MSEVAEVADIGPSLPSGFAIRRDGGKVAFDAYGPQNGYPVFFLHGTPGSRVGVLPRPFELFRRRVRLIAIDRPGYGMSDRRPDRDVAAAAEDVAAVADHLGLDRFSVSGRSGGAPHALACGALLPGRVDSVVALVSIAPFDSLGLDWFAGMTTSNVAAYELTRSVLDDPRRLPELTRSLARDTEALSADFIAERLYPELPPADKAVVGDARIRELLVTGFQSAVANPLNMVAAIPGADGETYLAGRFDDQVAFCSPWGFDPADIACPVFLWHGGRDVYSPPSHSEWLSVQIPNAVLDVDPAEAHFGAVRQYPHLLGWMLAQARLAGVGR